MRIVSLAHFATETLHLLASQRENTVLVAEDASRSHENTTVPGQRLPIDQNAIKKPEIPPALPACPDLGAFEPNLILIDPRQTDRHTLENQIESLPNRPKVLSLSPRTIEDMLDTVLTIGNAIGKATLAREQVVSLRARLWQAQERVNAYTTGPVVAAVLGLTPPQDPASLAPAPAAAQPNHLPKRDARASKPKTKSIIIAGDWIVQMIERAGAAHPLNPGIPRPTAGAASGPQMAELIPGPARSISLRAFADAMPEILLLAERDTPPATEPPPGKLELKLKKVLGKTIWYDLPAVRNGHIFPLPIHTPQLLPSPAPSPSLVKVFEQLVEIVRTIS